MPRTHEVQLVGEGLAFVGAVGSDQVHDLVDQDALTGGAAGMQAVIAVGVVGPVLEEQPYLVLAGDDDPAVSVLEVGGFGNETLGDFPGSPWPFGTTIIWFATRRKWLCCAGNHACMAGPRLQPGRVPHKPASPDALAQRPPFPQNGRKPLEQENDHE